MNNLAGHTVFATVRKFKGYNEMQLSWLIYLCFELVYDMLYNFHILQRLEHPFLHLNENRQWSPLVPENGRQNLFHRTFVSLEDKQKQKYFTQNTFWRRHKKGLPLCPWVS